MAMRTHTYARDTDLRQRAKRVVPGGVYGHQAADRLPEGFPQFFAQGRGCRVWDVDGNEYIDYLCSYGPIVLGHRHPAVERAAAEQAARGDCFNGPTERWVELAELLVEITPHADWAWFAKNGTDATTFAVTLARAHTGRKTILRAEGAYHGAAPWCTPVPTGVTPEDTANQLTYVFNDLESVRRAADRAGDDLAAVLVSPFRHDAFHDQEDVDPAFARGLRALCDEAGAVLILDDVRAGFRLSLGGSWEPLGVPPDVSAYCKAIANGYPIAAAVGREFLREAASRVYATGSYWFSGVPMAAAIATITVLRETDALARMERAGRLLREGLAAQAASHGLRIRQTGPVQVPFLSFEADRKFERAFTFTGEAARRGVYLHPWHNWFLSAAHTEEDIRATLEVTDAAFRKVREVHGEG
ncbi:MAG TPA: aminotransferase class III-fold pyridoxal phosphate-dependent enzyme [Dehalococcoidia bacterium]